MITFITYNKRCRDVMLALSPQEYAVRAIRERNYLIEFELVKDGREVLVYFKKDGDFDYEEKRAAVTEAAKGCVLNFLDIQLPDGFIPIMINRI